MGKRTYRPPGTLYQGKETSVRPALLTVHRYNAEQHEEQTCEQVVNFPNPDPAVSSWYDIDRVDNIETLQAVGKKFSIHPLLLEDISNTDHRPKMDAYEDKIFITLKMLVSQGSNDWRKEQLSIVLGKNYLITFQEAPGDVFDPIRLRLRQDKGLVRKRGADYLLFLLLDIVVDNYLVMMEEMGLFMDELEEQILNNPQQESLVQVQKNKREMSYLRKQLIPLRDAVKYLEKEDSDLLDPRTNDYFRDVYDHLLTVTESLDTYKELNSGLRDLYLSTLSNKMNEIMKVLTIISTIFIPLSFVAGLYGMNFKVIPELEWEYGYLYFWGLVLGLGALLFFFFKRKGWL